MKYTELECKNQIDKVTMLIFELKTIKDRKKAQEHKIILRKEFDLMSEMYKTYNIENGTYGFKQKYRMIKIKAVRIGL